MHGVCFTVTAAELHAAVIAAGTFWCCAFGCCDAQHVYNPLLLIAIFPPLPSDHLQEGEPLALLLKYTMCTVYTLYTIVHCAHYTYWWYHMHGTFAAFSLQLQFAFIPCKLLWVSALWADCCPALSSARQNEGAGRVCSTLYTCSTV